MQTFEHEIELQAKAADVFKWLTETEKLCQWLSGFVSSEPISGDKNEPGAKARVTIEENGRARVMVSEVLEIDQDRLLKVNVSGKGVTTISCYRLVSLGDSVLLTHSMEATFSGILGLLAPLFRKIVDQKMETDLGRLKNLVESREISSKVGD